MIVFSLFSPKLKKNNRSIEEKVLPKRLCLNGQTSGFCWSIRIILQDPMLHSESEGVKYYVFWGGSMALRRYKISLQIYVEKYFVSERSE